VHIVNYTTHMIFNAFRITSLVGMLSWNGMGQLQFAMGWDKNDPWTNLSIHEALRLKQN